MILYTSLCFFLQLTKSEDTSNVYATDAILSTIMCCSRSSNSWDVVVQKIAGKLFFDKRDDSEFGVYCHAGWLLHNALF